MTIANMRERAERVRCIPLERVLLMTNAAPDRHDKAKWHTEQGVISINGMKFTNWNSGVSGGGAIDLIIHLKHIGFKEAVQRLWQHFPSEAFSEIPQPTRAKPSLKLPLPNADKLLRVTRYLEKERGIPLSLIATLIESGELYADTKANAVFLLLGKKGPVGAEIRGTRSRCWRGMASGSQKDLGYFSIKDADTEGIVLCESAIDALSCFLLHPHYHCISTSGARSNPLWLTSFIQRCCQVHCGFDADCTGDQMAQAMMTRYPTVKRLRPSLKDWNDVLRSNRMPPANLPL